MSMTRKQTRRTSLLLLPAALLFAFALIAPQPVDAADCQGGTCRTSCDSLEIESTTDRSCPTNWLGNPQICCQAPTIAPACVGGQCAISCDDIPYLNNEHALEDPSQNCPDNAYGLDQVCCLVPTTTRGTGTAAEPEGDAFQAIEPTLSIPIPNLSFSEARFIDQAGDTKKLDLPFIADYVQAVYDYAVGIAAVLAATMMMIGGFQYLMAGGDSGKVSEAKKRITDALVGLVLALGAYTILTTMSDRLISLGSIRVETIKREILQAVEVADSGDVSVPSSGDAVCENADTCKPFCDAGAKNYPKSGGLTIDPSGTAPIQPSTGLRNPGIKDPGRGYATPAMTAALQKAGQIAAREGYEIQVVSAFRPLSRQFQIVCSVIAEGNPEKIGGIVSRPGASNHGTGKAADIALLKDGRQISATSAASQSQEKFRDPAFILANIMAEAGFKRYSKEVWHFEIDSDRPCRCSGSACPFPPKC